MHLFCQRKVALYIAGLAVALPAALGGQSVLERPPNIAGGWLGTRGTLQFNFVHRFGVSDAPLRKVTSSPTFLVSYAFPFVDVGFNYATSSDVAAAFPNEWEAYARFAPLRGHADHAAVQLGYNQAARSVDAEVALRHRAGPLRLVAVGRYLSDGYASDTARFAVGGGATIRLNRWFALAGDITTLLDRRANEEMAWGAGLQVAIPYSPHTFSLQVTNTNTATLQGSSRGIDRVRGGFEFTIPITLGRYFGGGRRRAAEVGAGMPDAANVLRAEIRANAFAPSRLEIAAGTTIRWTNDDQVVHTVTADDGSWDSGPIEPGASWSRTFDAAGDHSFHCTPHPFMRGVVVVR
jgi:plastocyanin